jgi:SAM-dependent methyltransferase
MDLETLRSHWDRFGASDPFWAVLTHPRRRFGGWKKAEFFQTGIDEIAGVFVELESCGLRVPYGRALDFGCGVGRLTAALAQRFAHADGVDIAPSMVHRARRCFRGDTRLQFHIIEDSLSLFPTGTFDFIYSAHVFQHMEPRYAREYVREFIRVLAPSGLAVVQITTEPFYSDDVTVADGCMGDEAFRARLAVSPVPALSVNERTMISVLIVNESHETWRSRGISGWYMVTVGNHWYNANNEMTVFDDGRVYLPKDVHAGESLAVDLEVTAPSAGGHYWLEVDLVQEGCGWFQDHSSTPARISVPVRQRSVVERLFHARRVPPPLGEPPIMEMYGVPEATMRHWIEAAGGKVLHVFDWSKIGEPGTDWVRRVFIFSRDSARQ